MVIYWSMPIIITEERFLSLSRDCVEQFEMLKAKFPEDQNFKKIGRLAKTLKPLYYKDKVYAVRHLNYLEKAQVSFQEERRALIVQMIELLQKLILHKKLNPEENTRFSS